MSKDFKEKYEKVCAIKDRALCLVENQLNGNIENVDAEELGEVMDIAKDCAELMELCAEAEYYHKVTEAMDESDPATKSMYLNKYIPEYEGRFYTEYPIKEKWKDDWKDKPRRTIYDPIMEDDFRNRMYYSNMGDNGSNGINNGSGMNRSNGNDSGMRNPNEGRSPMTRRTYMDMKENGTDKTKRTEEMKKYAHDLTDDLTEMLENASPEEKTTMKQLLANFVNKIA